MSQMILTETGFSFRITEKAVSPVTQVSSDAFIKLPVALFTALSLTPSALAATDGFVSAETKFHHLSMQIIDLITTLAEPILWGFAVVGFLLMVNDKKRGWDKVKATMYAFLGITLLPGIFSILTFIGKTIAQSFQS